MTRHKLTILHVCEHFGGQEASLHGVARGFQWWLPAYDAGRFRVLLCSRKGYDKAAAMMIQKGIHPFYLGHGKFDPRNLLRLVGLMRREHVDILHAHGWGASTWSRLAGMWCNTPVIIHERCNYGAVPLYQRPIERFFGPKTKHAFAVSESTRQFCIQKRHMPPDAVRVLYNGILLKDIPRVDQEWIRAFRLSRGVGPQDAVIGIVGRLESHKGHRDAFRALKRLLPGHPSTKLWILGDGAFHAQLQADVKDLGLENHVDFLGFRSDVLRVIRCLDVQLFPSHMEGTPNTLFEALAVGNSIVASTIDGQGEILEHGKTGLLFPPGDERAMAHCLQRVLSETDLNETLRKAALQRAHDFDGMKTVRAMEETYEAVWAERQRARNSSPGR
jgi:glycosyltransferase involved in cell wall biosynthesis